MLRNPCTTSFFTVRLLCLAGMCLGLAHLIQDDIMDTIPLFKIHIHRPIFMEIIIAMFWAIWSARNDLIFRHIQHSVASCNFVFQQELARVKLRAKSDFKHLTDLCIDSFVYFFLFSFSPSMYADQLYNYLFFHVNKIH